MALAVAALAVAVVPALGAGPAPEALFDTCAPQGGAAGQCNSPRGIATDPSDGHLFVADQINRRIDEFDAWGQFVKAWGFDVVASGPDETGTGFEVCNVAAHPEDVCQSGTNEPDGAGGFRAPVGVAVDSAGDVYAYDDLGRRLQKFDPSVGPDKTAAFLWAIGRNVDKTKVEEGGSTQAEKNICTATSGDECKIGEAGSGPGEFEIGILGAYVAVDTGEAVYPEDALYVGDKGRVQRFDTDGAYKGEFATPEATQYVQSLAVDGSGDLYAAYRISGNDDQPDVHKLSPTGSELCSFEVGNPRAIAVSGDGALYAYDKAASVVRRFGAGCGSAEEAPPVGEGEGLNKDDTGLATGSACLTSGHDLYLSNEKPESFVRVYGPAPDKTELCPRPARAPSIIAQLASPVEYQGATLRAKVNPEFWNDTRFYVEYGTGKCSEGGCPNMKPTPPGELLTPQITNKPLLTEGVSLTGLQPATTYHYRFVAESGGGGPVRGVGGTEEEEENGLESTFRTFSLPAESTSCPNEALRSGPGALLPDCRGYEMVSPVDKNGGEVDAYEYEGFAANASFWGLDQSAVAGSKLAYTASAAFVDSVSSPYVSEYLASRQEGASGAGSWSSGAISPPGRGGIANGNGSLQYEYKAFSQDLSIGWVIPETGLALAPCASEGYKDLYRRNNATGQYTALCSSEPEAPECPAQPSPPRECRLNPELEGYSADGSRAVFRVNEALGTAGEPEAAGTGRKAWQLYEWIEGQGLRLVSALPDGSPYEATSSAGSESSSGTLFGVQGNFDTVEHAMSEDGSRVYWSTDVRAEEGAARLYLRLNADRPATASGECEEAEPRGACTVAVSPPGIPAAEDKAQFWSASPDGSRAIYSVIGGLDEGKLYEYELAGEESTVIAKETLGVLGAARDLSRTYFASREVCSGEKQNSEGAKAIAGQPNVYLYEPGERCSEGEMTFVGTMLPDDISTGSLATEKPSPVASVPRYHVARVSPDGRHLAFVSAARLTAYDNADASSEEADREVYLFDAGEGGEGRILCPSCNPSGARPRGATSRPNELWTAAWLPGYQAQLYGRRPLLDSGRRLYFNSVDPLSPRDANGAQDVYQWEAPGSGDCTTEKHDYSAQNGGCVSLLSSGESPEDSEFVDASADGKDVFIRTESSLAPQDPGSVDIYDAREGGGEPRSEAGPSCEGDSCQSAPPAPGFQDPASSAFEGAGDLTAHTSCRPYAKRAQRLSRRAGRLRRSSGRVRSARQARRLRRKSARLAHRAQRLSKGARRCRRANRRAGR